MLNILLNGKPIIVRREDGFEKRYVVKCSRCKLDLGYYLDWNQFDDGEHGDRMDVRDDVLYILPGALLRTDDMEAGRKPSQMELSLQHITG